MLAGSASWIQDVGSYFTSIKFVVLVVLCLQNILSFVALRHLAAGPFAVLAQLKILTTAACSSLLLGRRYTPARWRALLQLTLGVLLFSAPLFDAPTAATTG